MARARTITGVLAAADRGGLAAIGVRRHETVVRAGTGTVAGVLHHAFRPRVAAGRPGAEIVGLARARTITGVLAAAGRGGFAAIRVRRHETVVRAGTGTVAGILHHALGSGVAAGRPGVEIVGLARARTITGVLAAAGRGGFAAIRVRRHETVVRAGTGTVAGILHHALGSGVAAGRPGVEIVGLARACAVAGVLAAAGRGGLAAIRVRRHETVVRAGTGTVAGVLHHAFRPRVAAGRPGVEIVGLARARTITGVLAAADRGGLAAIGVRRHETVVRAGTGTVAGVLHHAFRPRVAAKIARRRQIRLASPRAVASVRVIAGRLPRIAAGRTRGLEHAGDGVAAVVEDAAVAFAFLVADLEFISAGGFLAGRSVEAGRTFNGNIVLYLIHEDQAVDLRCAVDVEGEITRMRGSSGEFSRRIQTQAVR